MKYEAFLSYSHAADERLGAVLQASLQRFAKPWYRLRAVNVFRDKTGLAVTPALWPSIEAALAACDFFILMAGPEAAASPWVAREVEWWRANRSIDTLLIVLTGGELVWSNDDFDWQRTTALPSALQHAFPHEPLHLDLRWARTADHLSLRDPRFQEAVADLAAPLRGATKDSLIGEDVRQHRRTRLVAWSAGAMLVLLTGASLTAGWMARQQRNRAVLARSEAEGLIQFMLFDLRDKLEPIGRLDLLEDVNRRTRAYYQAFPVSEDNLSARYQRAVALAAAGDYLRRRGDSTEALRTVTESFELLAQSAREHPADPEVQRHLSIATVELARAHQDLGDLPTAEALMRSAVKALEPLMRDASSDALRADAAYCKVELGRLLHERRNDAGLAAFDEALTVYKGLASQQPSNVPWQQRTAEALAHRGALLKDLGRLPEALRSYSESFDIVRKLAEREPADMPRQQELAVGHGALASVLAEQGDAARAEKELSARRAILERLVKHDPPNALWQLGLADADGQMGTFLGRVGRVDDAVRAHAAAITRLERLVALNPRNPAWAEALASAHDSLGDTSFAAGRFRDGIVAYQQNLKVMQQLAKDHPDHPRVQRAKAIAYAKAAQIYADGLQDLNSAMTMYRSVIATFERTIAEHPRNVVAQDDLAVVQEKVGRAYANAGQIEAALQSFRTALELRSKLAAGDPSNMTWQGSLITLRQATGGVLLARGEMDAAKTLFDEALTLATQLAKAHPDELSWHSLAAVSHERLGTWHRRRGNFDAALAAYRGAETSLGEVLRLAPASPDAQQNLAVMRQAVQAMLAEGKRRN
jgi:tetratricopeptide (TPR) repeat protein